MPAYNVAYNFNRKNNIFNRFRKLTIIGCSSFFVTFFFAFMYFPIQKFRFGGFSDSHKTSADKQFFSLHIPVIPERITPPRFAPFEKTDKPVNLSLELSNSFEDTLLSYGLPQEQVTYIKAAAKPFVELHKLHKGHKINVMLAKNAGVNLRDMEDSVHIVRKISLYTQPTIRLEITGDGTRYKSKLFYDKVYEKSYLASGKITSSISVDAKRAGASASMIQQFVKLFSLNVDFRQLQKNDSFEFGFDKFTDKEGNLIGHGHLNYASLTVNDKKNEIYYITDDNGKGIWINEKGMNNKPLLMKTPIDGARLSSGFGSRKHPILGYTKQHTGIDFAAPTGTPIYAAGDGVIVQKYRSSSYGNYIKIRHNSSYDTAYAHMSRFAKFSSGTRVSQGDIIGYVGTTGRSTGPHLHYEIHKSGIPVDPLSNKVPTVSSVTVSMKNKMSDSKQKLVDLRSGKEIKTIHKTINDIKYKII